MRYISANSRTEYCESCAWAVAELTPELLEEIKRRKVIFEEAHKKDSSLYCLQFWDSSPDFYDNLPEGLEGMQDMEGYVVDDDPLPVLAGDEAPSRVECCIMIVHDRGFFWVCHPKHTDFRVETGLVRWEDVNL